MKVFDYQSALERACDNKEFLLDLILGFEGSFPQNLQKVRMLISELNTEQAYKEVHSLKGALVNLGAEKAGALAKQIEIKLREGDTNVNLEELERLVSEFLEEAKRKLS
ncbi:MAG: Hpt domain-containing protein [Thermoplasmatales archaeon]